MQQSTINTRTTTMTRDDNKDKEEGQVMTRRTTRHVMQQRLSSRQLFCVIRDMQHATISHGMRTMMRDATRTRENEDENTRLLIISRDVLI
jgi:hypothetical protein